MENYYVFDGQNASTGEPNRRTGRMSFYGMVRKFESKREAIEYAADNEKEQAQYITIAGTKSDMRKYCLGCSVADFEYNLGMGLITKKVGDTWIETY